jgi:Zn-dependent peptidase ImmA (M78 family)/DNA-binding XRE family transcriptional regulator
MISGDRVKQARELRGLTQIELAKRVEVNQSTIAYIESARLTPSRDLLDAIAGVTQFPSAFFEQDPPGDFPLGSLVLFRARASVTAREETQVHQYGKAVYEWTGKLARRVTTIPLRLPQLTDEIPEHAAGITRAAIGLSPDTPINDLIYTIERAGVAVLALPLALERIDAFSLWSGPDSDQPVIIVLGRAPGDRLRFSVAHEMGHLVMHRSIRGDVLGIEKEADRFAGALLLPESAMRQELIPPLTLTALAALKRRWHVSMQALVMRAFEVSIITNRQKRYLFQQLSARGWRTREPPALDVPIERPRALRQMAELLYGVPIDYGRLAKDVHLPQELLRDVMEAHAGHPQGQSNVIPFPAPSPGRSIT